MKADSADKSRVSFAQREGERDPWDFPAIPTIYRKDLATPEEYAQLVSEGKVPPLIDGTEASVEEWREAAKRGTVPPVIEERNRKFAEGKGVPTPNKTEPTVS